MESYRDMQMSSVPATPIGRPMEASVVAAPLAEAANGRVLLHPQSNQAPGRKIRVLLADDSAVARNQLAQLLRLQTDVEVVGQAGNGLEAVQMVLQLQPDVVVMDVTMPVLDGIEATYCIHQGLPSVRVLGLSMHDEENTAAAMVVAGAAGYLVKTTSPAKLIAAIREAGTCVCRS